MTSASTATAQPPGAAATPDRQGLILLALLTVFWGANWAAMRLGVAEIDPWSFRFATIVQGFVGLFIIARIDGQRIRLPREHLWPLIAAAMFNVTGWHIATGFGLTMVEAGRAAIIAYTMPLWVTLMGTAFLGERVRRVQIAGLVVGLAGLGVLIAPDFQSLTRSPVGVLLILAASLSWSIGIVITKATPWRQPMNQVSAWQLLLGGVPVGLGVVTLGAPETLLTASPTALVATAYAGSIAMVFCFYTWLRLLGMMPASVAAISTLAIPVVGVLSGAIILAETVGATELTSLGLVVAALALTLIAPALIDRRR